MRVSSRENIDDTQPELEVVKKQTFISINMAHSSQENPELLTMLSTGLHFLHGQDVVMSIRFKITTCHHLCYSMDEWKSSSPWTV